MRWHLLAAGFLLLVLLAWGFGLRGTLNQAELPDEASGRLVAVFPLRYSGQASFIAASSSGGAIAREVWLSNMLIVQDATPGLAARLRAAGAVAIYPAAPFESFSFSGCTGLPPKPLRLNHLG